MELDGRYCVKWSRIWRGREQTSAQLDEQSQRKNQPMTKSTTKNRTPKKSKLKRFAQNHGVHVWLVAHPSKPEKMDQQNTAPSLMAISGSANFVNKADFGISIHRPWNPDGSRSSNSEVHIKKSRHRHLGRPGVAHLHFNPSTGRYEE